MKKELMQKLPEIRRDVSEFISDERGLVSKEKILKATFALGVGSTILSAAAHAQTTHSNTLTVQYAEPNAAGSHSHHASHTSY
jgi:hypothetical protein